MSDSLCKVAAVIFILLASAGNCQHYMSYAVTDFIELLGITCTWFLPMPNVCQQSISLCIRFYPGLEYFNVEMAQYVIK